MWVLRAPLLPRQRSQPKGGLLPTGDCVGDTRISRASEASLRNYHDSFMLVQIELYLRALQSTLTIKVRGERDNNL